MPLILAAVVLGAVLAATLVGPHSPPTSPAPTPVAETPSHDVSHQPPASIRTLVVYTDAEPSPSAHPERMRALLTKGKLPGGVVEATVFTDDDCAPTSRASRTAATSSCCRTARPSPSATRTA